MGLSKDNWLSKANEIHNNKYDYSLVIYKNVKTKVNIVCKEHGVFSQTLEVHINKKCGCKRCNLNKDKLSNDYLLKFNEVHGTTYDYSLVEYKNMSSKVKIICKQHGIFEQTPNNHITKKHKCPKCSIDNKSELLRKDIQILESELVKINDTYIYDLLLYENRHSIIDVSCKEHGLFRKSISSLLNFYGCPKCKMTKGEYLISKELDRLGIEYSYQKSFEGLKSKKTLFIDFYLPTQNVCIEFDGIYHRLDIFGNLNESKVRDEIKNKFCLDNNIKLLRIDNYKDIQNLKELI